MANDDRQLTSALNELKIGAFLAKQKFNGKKFNRRFYLHDREGYITYERSKKIFGKPRTYQVRDIDEIRTGFHAQTFHRLVKSGRLRPADEERAFSILYDNHRKEEHFLARDKKTRDLWIAGLQHLVDRNSQQNLGNLIHEENWILNFFHAADKDKSNTLTKKECRDLLLKSFQVEVPNHVFEQLFRQADKSHEGLLNAEEFLNFFQLITRRKDLYEIMKKHVNNGTRYSMDEIRMNGNELFGFLQEFRNKNLRHINRIEQVQNLIDEFEMDVKLRQNGLLSVDGFRNLLLSKYFDVVDSAKSTKIYQDMTRPLCDYYINTSHNTYLFYSQLTGDSNPEAYNRVLLMGCRAVELDCYDGGDEGPIVYHAHTLVKPCTFESIIRCMEPNLFKASPYPVILNIENHCSPEKQQKMARILKEILGDRILTKPLPGRDPTRLPSPEDLKYKVLVRSKKTSSEKTTIMTRYHDGDDFVFNPVSRNIQPELAELFVYLQNVPYLDYDHAKAKYTGVHSTSLAEKTFFKHAEEDPISLILQTTWRLIRLYPDGLRQDSSNPDPARAWNYGIQLVALNYQNDGDMMSLVYGKFSDNGGCGYVLKPDYLLNPQQSHYNPLNTNIDYDIPVTLAVKIISGQFLPRSSAKSSDIPDPYVKVSIHGMECDEKHEKTKFINNNGFDPNWDETFYFRIRFPQLALIYISVMDYDALSQDDRIAYFCAPLTMIQTGYRHIRLRAHNNDPTYSTLFVYIDIRPDGDIDNQNVIFTRL